MNKRQAKKAFKKKYGVNPAEFEKQMDLCLEQISKIDWQEIGRTLAENMATAINDLAAAVCDGVKSISDIMNTPEFKEALEKYRKEQEEKDVH